MIRGRHLDSLGSRTGQDRGQQRGQQRVSTITDTLPLSHTVIVITRQDDDGDFTIAITAMMIAIFLQQ